MSVRSSWRQVRLAEHAPSAMQNNSDSALPTLIGMLSIEIGGLARHSTLDIGTVSAADTMTYSRRTGHPGVVFAPEVVDHRIMPDVYGSIQISIPSYAARSVTSSAGSFMPWHIIGGLI
ncbi:hypothetical protein [Bradyrhizobium sp. SEMIA]|uniref:hypothetical protein n=1 Tax=Bradyrhizobium sp. SEMIA TaxID=2597515 RepID=UPI0018A36D17|nr:hypothetical protein [Bradyrhizobium sp. SEMIA]QOG21818.1 hypothetical protein FOM02_35555 [Bradyrhizobium sp. SEMIA]